MNNMDRGNTLVCSISIVLGLLIYQTTILKYTALATTFWVVLGFVNFLFIAVLLWLVLEGYINKLAEKLDPIRDKINAKHPHL
jgi:preprotein translocase subunit SecF